MKCTVFTSTSTNILFVKKESILADFALVYLAKANNDLV
jgi:hypothetical protein